MLVEAYSFGAPVAQYQEICDSMSPIKGHNATAQSSPPPFEIRSLTTSNCYKVDEPITVQVDSKHQSMYFEGLFVQARTVLSNRYDTGSFDVLGDSELEILTCGNTMTNNALGQREAHHYSQKKFSWTPSADHGDIRFVATIVHGTAEYWMDVTSSPIRYDVNCVYNAAAAVTTPTVVCIQLLLLLAALEFVWM